MTPLHHPVLHPGPELPRIPHSRCAGGQLVDGPATAELERKWCEITGAVEAAAVGSGTAALRLALVALGCGSGDEVIVPAYSCVALLNAVLATGAYPVLADVRPANWTLDPESTRRMLSPLTRAIVAVNLFGVPADVQALERLGVPVVEDCAHGPLLNRGFATISSFYATKLVGAGMGGIVASEEPELVSWVRRHRSPGDQSPSGNNLNDRIGEDCARRAADALIGLQFILLRRAELAAAYFELLADMAREGHLTVPNVTRGHVWYRFTPKLRAGLTAPPVVAAMKAVGVDAEQPVWDLRGSYYWHSGLPGATEAFERLISLPIYPGLTETEQRRVVDALETAIQGDT